METRFRTRATVAQANYLFDNYCVKMMNNCLKVKPDNARGDCPVFVWSVLLRHPEGMKIPHEIEYEELINKLIKAYKQ